MSTLFIVATPIGNLEDVTYRTIRVLNEVDVLACEDTRRTRIILQRYKIAKPRFVFSYREHNEISAGKRILGFLESGSSVALCTNAGYPGVSDPGYRVITSCIEAGHQIEVIPGAGAVSVALLLSGLPTSSYTFKGFPPRKSGRRKKFLSIEKDMPHTLVLFESPFRLGVLLREAHEVLGNRAAAVCIELTKMFQEVHRGYLSDLAARFSETKVKGEVTLVIAGSKNKLKRPEEI